jgi:hypothetical protein
VSKRPKKNRSARDKQLTRQRARRDARQRDRGQQLYYLQPPFEPYKEWIRVPEEAQDAIEYPAGKDQLGDAKWLADLIVKLGPRY